MPTVARAEVNQQVLEAAVADLQAASQLAKDVAGHAADLGLSEKQVAVLQKAGNVLLHIRSQMIQSQPRMKTPSKLRD